MPHRMSFVATMDGKEHKITVEPIDGERYKMTLDGRAYDVDATRMPSQIVSILLEGKSYDVDLERQGKRGDPLDGRMHVRVRGRVLRLDVLDERRKKMKEAQSIKLDMAGAASIDSPMPGKVLKLLAKEGDEVKEGQGIVVVEAMKMENELKTPKAGRVKTIHAKEGETVDAGARLVTIE